MSESAVTVDNVSSPEVPTHKMRTIRFKQIRAVYETLRVQEPAHPYISPNERYTSPEQIFNTFSYLRSETREIFLCLHLNGKNSPVCVDVVSIGSLNQSIVHPREVFAPALLSKAAAILLVHQHPTGDPTPSREDIAITKRLREAGELLGVRVLDHIIIGDTFMSFASSGMM